MDLDSKRQRQPSVPDASLTWCLQNLLAKSEEFEETIAEQKTQITQLELANGSLESRNVRMAKENEALSYDVDALNRALEERDARIDALAATLHSTHEEVDRLTILVSKTEQLEEQLRQMDIERSRLQDTLAETEGEKKQAKAARRKSERDYHELEQQIEMIEMEARQDRQKHADAMTHLGIRTPSGKDIDGRSSSPSMSDRKPGSGMSNFVNQILEENSTLRVDISELEALLRQTRDEMEDLRAQVLNTMSYDTFTADARTPKSLGQELMLGLEPRNTATPEVHVHHHYHDPSSSSHDRDSLSRSRTLKPKKRRQVLSSSRATSAYYNRPTSLAFSSSPGSESPLDCKRWSSYSGGTHSTALTASTIPSSPPMSVSSYFDNLKPLPPLSPLEDYDLPPTPLPIESGTGADDFPTSQEPTKTQPPTSKDPTFRPPLNSAVSAKQNSLPVLSSATAQAQASAVQPENTASSSDYLRNQQDALKKRQSAPVKETYAPVRDTFGWFKSRWSSGGVGPQPKGGPTQRVEIVRKGAGGRVAGRATAAAVEGAVVDEDALAECLGEDQEAGR